MQPTPPDHQCLSEPILVAYVEGRLSEPDARRAELHLDECPECLRVVALLGATDPPLHGESASRYTLGEEIARGGMGRILAAWDEILERPVALKTVRSRDALSRGRFAREMLVTARLQHPSIVPVYDGGTLPDGAPYYAMRRVDGRELETCIRESVTVAQRLALLRPFIALVDAVAYAHSQGFVHRDLKPRNVLVGPFGETVVLDWGLARSVDAAIPEDGGTGGDSVDDGLTNTGSVMGTPGYIAPEILHGLPATTSTDVYSLGVILAQIVTGDARESTDGLLRAAGAPADLVAIARRATQARSEDRYADARALADDLRRFEAGRLVGARAYGLFDRLARFIRHHRAAVAVATLASVLLVAMAGWSYRNVAAARDRAELALADAQMRRGEAESEREAAEELIDFALEDLSEQLRSLGRIDLLRAVVEEVDAYYDGRAPRTDRASALRLGRALWLHGRIASRIGDDATAVVKLEQANATFVGVANDDGSEIAELMRCEVLGDLAAALKTLGRLDDAERAALECIGVAQKHLAQDPGAAAWVLTIASLEMAQALVELARGQSQQARGTMASMLSRIEGDQWQGENLARVANLRRLVGSRLGLLALNDRQPDQAVVYFRTALEVSEQLRRLRPGNGTAIAAVAGARLELASALQVTARLDDAERELQTAIGTYRLLLELELEPANTSWARNLSRTRRTLADTESRQGRLDAAIATTRSNIEAVTTLLEQRIPDAWDVRLDLGFLRVELGNFLRRGGQAEAAAKEFERGLAEMEGVVAQHSNAETSSKLGFALLLHGDFELERGDLERAARSLERARELARQQLAAQPTAGTRVRVAEPTARLVVIAWKQGQPGRARAWLRETVAELADARRQGATGQVLDDLRSMLATPARALGESLDPSTEPPPPR